MAVGLAGSSRNASSGSSPALATALSVQRSQSTSGDRLSRGDEGSAGSSRGSSRSLSRGRRRGGGTTGSSVPDSRAGNGVRGEAAVDVEEDTGVGGLVCAGNGDTGGQSNRAGGSDPDLYALHVELGARGAVALVESDDLGTEEIVAGGEVGECDAVLAAVGNQVVDGPFAVGVTLLGELDPDIAVTVGRRGCNVGKDWSLVRL